MTACYGSPVVSASCQVGTRKDLTDPVNVSLLDWRACRFTLRKAIAVYRSRLRCSGVANATPKNASLELIAHERRASYKGTACQYQQRRSKKHPCFRILPTACTCSSSLPTGTNRMNSCRSTANHESLSSALRCKRYAEQTPETLLHCWCTPRTLSKQLACSTSQGEGGSCPQSDWSDTPSQPSSSQVRCSQQTPRQALRY